MALAGKALVVVTAVVAETRVGVVNNECQHACLKKHNSKKGLSLMMIAWLCSLRAHVMPSSTPFSLSWAAVMRSRCMAK